MKCGSEKLRSLVKEYFGEEELDHYDEMVDQCKLGQALKDDRVWAPLCPDYPNLKGVTCEEIDKFSRHVLPNFFNSTEYKEHVKNIRDEHERILNDDEISDTAYDEMHNQLITDYIFLIKNNVLLRDIIDPEVRETITDVTTGVYVMDNVSELIDRTEYIESSFAEDYFHHVKSYDRDEAYQAFKKIGAQIEKDAPGILHDPSTIFVTTPRGGHEMLSIFSYANDLKKAQVPSDITWSHLERDGFSAMHEHEYRKDPHKGAEYDDAEYDTEIHGTTWMGHHSDPVKNIFIVDDIIASGEQIHHTKIELDAMFPGANINSVTLCKRGDDVLSPAVPKNVEYYTDTETIGIHSFKDRRLGGVVGKEYITCIFSHACPDGASDELMVKLMGDKRCSPEKRISKRDL